MSDPSRRLATVAIVTALWGCRDPTQITLVLSTDVDCGKLATTIAAGAVGEVEHADPVAVTDACRAGDGRIGSLVMVPAGEGPRELTFRIVSSVGAPAEACVAPDYGPDCIVARRTLHYLAATPLVLPVVMRQACKGVVCPVDETCVNGKCASALVDADQCASPTGCGEDVLHLGDGGGSGGSGGAGGGGGAGGAGGSGGAGGAGGNAGGAGGAGGGSGGGGAAAPGWSLQIGGVGQQLATSVAVDTLDNVFVGGAFEGTVDFGDGPHAGMGAGDGFVASYDAAGKFRWLHALAGGGDARVHALAVTPFGEVYAVGRFTVAVDLGNGTIPATGPGVDAFVLKLDAAGGYLWGKTYGALGGVEARGVAAGPNGSVVFGGGFTGTVSFGGPFHVGQADVFLVRLAPDGSFLWSQQHGDAELDRIDAMTSFGDRVFVCGRFRGTMDLGGQPVPSKGQEDVFVAALDKDATFLWGRAFGNPGIQTCSAIVAQGPGQVIVTGTSAGTIDYGGGFVTHHGAADAFVVSLKQLDGGHLWSGHHGGILADQGNGVAANGSGVIAYTGAFVPPGNIGGVMLGTNGPSFHLFAVQATPEGKTTYARGAGSGSGDAIAVDSKGNMLVAGTFSSAIDFGHGTLVSQGSVDAFVTKLVPP